MNDKSVHVSKVRGVVSRFFVKCNVCGAKGVGTLTGGYTDMPETFGAPFELDVNLHEVLKKRR